MFALPIAERTWRKDSSKVLSDVNSWLRMLLEKADTQASIELSDDGWFVVKGEGAKFTLNVLNKLCYYPVAVGHGEERTSKVSGVDSSKAIHVMYPNEDGRTVTTTITVKELMARLKNHNDYCQRTHGTVEGEKDRAERIYQNVWYRREASLEYNSLKGNYFGPFC